MPALDFSKWSPGGNTTLFFPADGLDSARQADLARQAMRPESLDAEQAGFISVAERRLRMAGGEFCVNAARAFGALLAFRESASPEATLQGIARQKLTNEHRYEIHVSGWQTPVRLLVRGTPPHWQVRAELQLPPCPISHPEQGIHLVRLPGICHLLLDGEVHMQPEDCIAASRMLRRQYGMTGELACGVVWWGRRSGMLDMLPVVHVRDAHTTCIENACGSGALALALLLAAKGNRTPLEIMQPGGSALHVHIPDGEQQDRAFIDGPVDLVARGRVWLPDVQA